MDVSKLFKGQKLSIECPNCNKTFTFDASLAFKRNSKVTCSNCSTEINLDNTNAKKDAEKAINGIKKMFK